MANRFFKTIMKPIVICMTILTVGMHSGTLIVNADQADGDADVSETDYQYMTYVDASGGAIYSLKDSRNYGVADSIANLETRIDFEGVYGLRLNIIGNQVWYSAYQHNSAISDTVAMTLYKIQDRKLVTVRDLGTASVGTDRKMTVRLSDDIIYVIGAEFVIDGIEEPQESYGYLYQHDGTIQTCRLSPYYIDVMENDIAKWNKLMADADPDDYLSNADITYPTSGVGKSCNHVAEWEDISDTLIKHDDWTDEMKVYAFVDYLAKNIAYDNYRYIQLNNKSRANLAKNYTDDNNFTLGNNVGVCWDYTNILTIMCRHHGIPATSVENKSHTWNAIWLDDEWVGIDLTDMNRYFCNSEDTDSSLWESNKRFTYFSYGCAYGADAGLDTHDESIWTREKGLGLK